MIRFKEKVFAFLYHDDVFSIVVVSDTFSSYAKSCLYFHRLDRVEGTNGDHLVTIDYLLLSNLSAISIIF